MLRCLNSWSKLFKTIKAITIRISFCTLFTSVIAKILFKLVQQVVLQFLHLEKWLNTYTQLLKKKFTYTSL